MKSENEDIKINRRKIQEKSDINIIKKMVQAVEKSVEAEKGINGKDEAQKNSSEQQNTQKTSDIKLLKNLLNNVDKRVTTYKALKTISEKIKNNSDDNAKVLLLYNLLIQPAQRMKQSIEEQGKEQKINNAVVAVYGATVNPIKKRVQALADLGKYINLEKGVIFSGGRSWTSIVPDNFDTETRDNRKAKLEQAEAEGTKKLNEAYNAIREEKKNHDYNRHLTEAQKAMVKELNNREIVRKRAKTILRVMPEVVEFIKEEERATWENLQREEMIEEGKESYHENYEKMYENHIVRNVENFKIFMKEIKSYEWWKKEGQVNADEKDDIYLHNKYLEDMKEEDKSQLSEVSKYDFERWYSMYKDYTENHNEYEDGCKKWEGKESLTEVEIMYHFMESRYFQDKIIHKITESDLMKITYEKMGGNSESIIEDRKATNTLENAENTLEEFEKLRKDNPSLDTLVVVSDWQYLLRQVQTTKKVAKRMGIDVNIVGYPADLVEQFHNEKRIALKFDNIIKYVQTLYPELEKIINYSDVQDKEIDTFLEEEQFVEADKNGGPIVLIGEDTLQEYVKMQKAGKGEELDLR